MDSLQGKPTPGAGLLLIAMFLVAALCAARQIATWPARLAYPGDGSAGGDSLPLTETVHLARGIPIYAPYTGERYDAANWGPLFYLLGSRLVNPARPAYFPLRALALAGMLGCTISCAALAFCYSRSKMAAALAALLFLSYGFVNACGASSRPDTVELLLVSAGFLIAYHFRDSSRLLLAVPFMLLGFFYKPQYIAGSLAIFAFLLWRRRVRLAAQFAGLLALGGAGLLLFFQFVVFPGQAFLDHFVSYNLLPFTGQDYARQILFFCLALLVPLLLSLQSLRVKPDSLLLWYLGSAAVLELATSGRAGSGLYYFFELAFLESALVATLAARTVARSDFSLRSDFDLAILILVLVTFFGVRIGPSVPPAQAFRQDGLAQDYLREHFPPGTRALSDFPGDLMRAGLDAPISNIFHYTWLVRKGVFSDAGLLAQIRRHDFGVIELAFDLGSGTDQAVADFYLTRKVQDAILQDYRLQAALPGILFYAWVPRAGPADDGAAAPK